MSYDEAIMMQVLRHAVNDLNPSFIWDLVVFIKIMMRLR